MVFCTACGELFLARLRLIGEMRTWTLDDATQAQLSREWRKEHAASFMPAPRVARAERELRQFGKTVACDTCEKRFDTESARDAHVLAKHPTAD